MNPSVLVFVFIYILSFMFVMGVNNWFLVWLGLEMNMLSFIFLMYFRESMTNIESCLKYFFIQSVGSAFFISMFFMEKGAWDVMGSVVLSYKMGGGPFFFWFPSVCEGISWWSCFFLMTLQKVLPLVLIMGMLSWVVWVILVVSLLIGVMGSLNQINVSRLMAFSSIHQIGWLLMCMMVDNFIWLIYFFVYFVVFLTIVVKVSEWEINNFLNIELIQDKWLMVLMMMNLGGMPPFMGFFLKWLGFYYFIKMDCLIVFFMVVMSVVMFYVYMRVCYVIFMGGGLMMGWEVKKEVDYKMFMWDILMMMGMGVGGLILSVFLF